MFKVLITIPVTSTEAVESALSKLIHVSELVSILSKRVKEIKGARRGRVYIEILSGHRTLSDTLTSGFK